MNETYLLLVALLVLFGVLSRVGCRESRRPWMVTVVSLLLSAVLWAVSMTLNTRGNEGPAVLAVMVLCFAIGALAVEVAFLVRQSMGK